MTRRRTLAIVAALVAVLAIVAVVAHDALAAWGVRAAVGSLGYGLTSERTRVALDGISLVRPVIVNTAGEPVFRADRVDVKLDLRDLLPGSTARFGLRAVDLERPVVTLIHHPDGTYNIALPQQNGPPARPDTTPFDLRIRVRDGTVALLDRFVVPGHERRQSLERVGVDAVLAPHDPAYYRVDALLHDGKRTYPIAGRARFDHARRFASQHWHAAELPIGPLVDFAIVTHDINLVDGRLHDVDARIYGFIHDDGTTDAHAGGSARLSDGKVFLAQLAVPLGDARGMLRVYDDGLDTSGLDATLARVPLHVVGGIYHVAAPRVRFLLTVRGPLERLRTISRDAARRPVSGDVSVALRADGPLSHPLVRGTFASPAITYDRYTVRHAVGSIAFQGEEFQILGVRGDYGRLALGAQGLLRLAKHVDTTLVARVSGPAGDVPYAASVLPNAQLDGVVALSGTDSHLGARGLVTGDGPGLSLSAPFDVDPDGVGTIGPLALDRSDGGSVYARATLDRPHGDVDGVIDVRALQLAHAPLSGRVDAHLAGGIHGSTLSDATGTLAARDLRYGAARLGDADARIASDGGLSALNGTLRADLAGIGRLAGVSAHGIAQIPLRAVTNGARTVAQIDGARFDAAAVRGIVPQRIDATAVLQDGAVRVAALALAARGIHVDAAGTGDGDAAHLVATFGAAAPALRAAGLPLNAGALSGAAGIDGALRAPRGDVLLALDGANVGGTPVDGIATATYADGTLHLDDARALVAGGTARASGTVARLGAGTPQVALATSIFGLDIATLARAAHVPLRYPAGRIDADARIAGTANAPSVDGEARIGAGSINGLAFTGAVVPVRGTARDLRIAGGRATVGSTTVRVDAAVGASRARVALHAPHLDLADFNDYFDAADTLAGTGAANVAFASSPSSLATSGTVKVAGARYRRIPLGDVAARWRTGGRRIAALLDVGGAHGALRVDGSATLPATDPLRRFAASNVDATARMTAFDLTTWLPAAGVVAPVTGFVDGTARVHGIAPAVAVSGNATLRDGVVGRVPIRSLTANVVEEGGHARLVAARLDALDANATASGTFGLAPASPLALTIHAATPDIGALANHALGTTYDAAGALAATLNVGGTARAPRVAAVADLAGPRYEKLRAKSVHVESTLGDGRFTVQTARVDLLAGSIVADASVAATTAPPFVDRRNAPIAGHLRIAGLDLAPFGPMLPNGTQLGGVLNGDLALSGTMRDPSLGGSVALAKGSYVSHLLASQLRNVTATLAFAGRRADLRALHADVGGGALDGAGSFGIGDLRDPARTLTAALDLRAAKAGIEVTNLFRGKIDGTLAARRAAGAPLALTGTVDVAHARIPLAALIPKGATSTSAAAPPPVAFDVAVAATTDDRVQGPFADVGATGAVRLGGTLAAPTLAGEIDSTDGTLSFYRTFVLRRATVAFDPSAGLIPNVDATATTHVPDPSIEVLLHAHGPATGLTLDLASRPSYDKGQIVGLLVGAQNLGAVAGVASTGGSGPSIGAGGLAENAIAGAIDQQFTRSLFEPFSSELGRSLGFSSLSINAGLTGGFSASASRALGKNLSATFDESRDAQGQRQSFALDLALRSSAQLQLTLFDAGTAGRSIGTQSPLAAIEPVNYRLESLIPPPGSSGYSITFQRTF